MVMRDERFSQTECSDQTRKSNSKETDTREDLRQELAELSFHLSHFLRTQVDLLRLSTRESMMKWMARLWGGLVLAVVTIVTSIFFMMGVAGGISELSVMPPWFGYLIAGALGIAVIAFGMFIWWRTTQLRRLRRYRQRYEQRRKKHENQFGHSHEETTMRHK